MVLSSDSNEHVICTAFTWMCYETKGTDLFRQLHTAAVAAAEIAFIWTTPFVVVPIKFAVASLEVNAKYRK